MEVTNDQLRSWHAAHPPVAAVGVVDGAAVQVVGLFDMGDHFLLIARKLGAMYNPANGYRLELNVAKAIGTYLVNRPSGGSS